MKDRYGFFFWLRWILWFAGSFILVSAFWTFLMKVIFGSLEGEEVTITWALAVFGSWFLLVIPFMRKKERIWKRLNDDQEKAVSSWFFGMALFIGLLVASALSWSMGLQSRIHSQGIDPLWGKAVFGSWLAALLPLLVFFYRQADNLFKEAEKNQRGPSHRSVYVERSRRLLPEALADKLKAFPSTLHGGYLVSALLKNGQRVDNIFILNANEIAGIYNRNELNFSAADIVEIEKIDPANLPAYEESKWLRLDGRI